MLKVITLDLDNTLWDVDRIIHKAEADMKSWMTRHAPNSMRHYEPHTLAQARTRVAARAPDKVHDLSFMRQQVLREIMLLAGYSQQQADELAAEAFTVFYRGRNTVEFYPGAKDMLSALSRHYVLFALTNGNADIELAGIGEFFTGALSSADVGYKKPDAAIFRAALSKLNVTPAEAAHVGDNLVDDVHGANNAGMHSVWVNLNQHNRLAHDPVPDQEVDHLDQVHQAILRLSR